MKANFRKELCPSSFGDLTGHPSVMRKPIATFDRLLELLGITARTLCLLPVWMTLSNIVKKAVIPPLFYCSILLFCGMLNAITARGCAQYYAKTPLTIRLIRYTVMLAAAIGTIWLCHHWIGLPCAVLLTCTTLLYSKGSAKRSADQLFDINAFVGFLTLHTLAAMVLNSVALSPPLYVFVAAAAVQTAIFLLLRNQYTLLRLVNRRSDDALPIPKEIRRINLQLILLVLGITAALFLFSKPLAFLMETLGNGGKWLLRMILQGMTYLIQTLSGSKPAVPTPVPDAGAPPLPDNTDGNPWWNLLWLLLIPPILWIWKTLLSDWFYQIRLHFAALSLRRHQANRSKQEIHAAESEEYTDIETICAPLAHASPKAKQRLWKKQFKKWKGTAPSMTKFNEGYRLMLTAPAWQQDPHPSDTPYEILADSQTQISASAQKPLAQITNAFAQIRYAEQPMPLEALSAMEQTLHYLSVPSKEQASGLQSSSVQKGVS